MAGKRSKEHAAAREEGPCCCCSALREHQSATHAPAAVGISQPFPPLLSLSLSLLRVCVRSPASSLSPPSSIWAVPTPAVLNKSVSETLPRPKPRLARSSRSTRLPALSFVPCVAYVCLLHLSAHPPTRRQCYLLDACSALGPCAHVGVCFIRSDFVLVGDQCCFVARPQRQPTPNACVRGVLPRRACCVTYARSLDALTRLRGRRAVVMLTTMGASYETINVIIVVVVALVYSYRLVNNNNNDDETNNLSIG